MPVNSIRRYQHWSGLLTLETLAKSQNWRDIFTTSKDGLKLYARDYGSRIAEKTPVVCLAGLTRNSKDFHELATGLSVERRVLCLDYRGRGRSDYDAVYGNYSPLVEVADTFDVMAACGIDHAVIIGTSRGGILAMIMAVLRPSMLRGVVLNDIGAEIAIEGVLRISGYVGNMPVPRDWDEAVTLLQKVMKGHFPNLTDGEWMTFAKKTFRDDNGRPASDYDANLSHSLPKIISGNDAELPDMWPQFKALANIPTLLIRGENSDLLTAKTLKEMQKAHKKMVSVTLKDRGHTPFLTEPLALEEIEKLLKQADAH